MVAVPYPLTFGQDQLLDLGRVGGQDVLVRPMVVPIEMGINVAHLITAVRRVVRQRDALRMYIPEPDGAVQFAAEQRDVELIPADADPAAYGALELWVDESQPLVFSIDTDAEPPMLRLYLHHVFVDGWSCALILQDFYREYTAALHGQHIVGTIAESFGRYARDQRQRLAGPRMDVHNAFWANELRDAPPLALPYTTAAWRPGVRVGHRPTLGFEVTNCSMARLKHEVPELARSSGTAVLTAFAAALVDGTGQDDLVLHTTLADRGTSLKRALVGCLVNRTTVRLRWPAGARTPAAILAVRSAWARAARHQVGSFQRDGRHTDAGHILNLTPRVAVVVNDGLLPVHSYSTVGREEPRLGDLRRNEFATMWDTSLSSGDDLLLTVLPRRSTMRDAEPPVRFALSYREDLWDRAGIERLGTRTAQWLTELASGS